jgi:enoyl-[acyl-carrier-protein] reductase (NADH)
MKTRIILISLLFAGILLGLGCSTAVISPGTKTTAVYRMGQLNSTVSSPIGTIYQASEEAMQELGLNIVQRAKDQLEAQVVARDAQDNKIRVRLISLTEDTTKMTIHVDSLAKARRIYQAILDNLPKAKA